MNGALVSLGVALFATGALLGRAPFLQRPRQLSARHGVDCREPAFRFGRPIATAEEDAMTGERDQSGNKAGSGARLNTGEEAKPGTPGTGENVCPDCGGSGRVGAQACKTCGGTVKVIEGIGGG